MADVQLEHGHLRIANSLYRAINLAPFTDVQRRIVHALVGLTYGWNRKTVEIHVTELAQFAGIETRGRASGGFRTALADLIGEGAVQQLRVGDRAKPPVFAMDKDHERWGRYAVSAARLASIWGTRPDHADALLDLSRGPGERAMQNESADDKVASGEATSDLRDAASPEAINDPASREATYADVAFAEAALRKDVASPKTISGLGEGRIDAVSAYSVRPSDAGKTGKTVELQLPHNNSRERANEVASSEAAFDPASLLRWTELSALLGTDHNRAHVVAFLAMCAPLTRDGWCGRFANWLQKLDCPPSYAPQPEVLATALSEYKGDLTARHVWAFVEDCVRRWERAKGDARHMTLPPRAQRGSPDPAMPAAIIARSEMLYALGVEFELLTFDSESAYTARMRQAEKDPRAGVQFTEDITSARLWDGIGAIRQERFAVLEISRRLQSCGWKAAS